MSRHFDDPTLVIASHNPGKVREIAALLAPFGAKVVSAGELNLEEPEETGTTFIANAELKARATAEASGLPALADDSGLVVTALGGDPGIYSARWAGPDKDFGLAMQKVEDGLQGKEDRTAHFACALSLCWPDLASRLVRVLVARGNMPYSAVTQPWPESRSQPGTRSSTVAVIITLVSPKLVRHEPSACLATSGSRVTARSASAARPEGLSVNLVFMSGLLPRPPREVKN